MIEKKQIEELIGAYLAGEITDEDRGRLLLWIRESPENLHYFHQLKNLWQVANPPFSPESIDVGKALDKINEKISTRKWYQSRVVRYWQYVAAVVVLPLMVFSLYQFYENNRRDYSQVTYQNVFAPFGTHSQVTLPDGSSAWLNAGSSLRFPTVFVGGKREVELSGEAYFNVESDKEHPFVVSTEKVKVSAVGTAFNVEAYSADSIVNVTMESGKVNVELSDSRTLPLVAGERMGYNLTTEECRVGKSDPYKWSAWKDGALVFRDDPLEYVFKKIGQTFNVDILLKDRRIGHQLYRATFQNESLDEILRLLQLTAPIRYQYSSRERNGSGYFKRQTIVVSLVR